jgi:ribosomal protein L37E
MAGVVHSPAQEFWQPPAQAQEQPGRMVEVCDRCGNEFVVGARYCHVCGETRGARAHSSRGAGRYFRPVGNFFLSLRRAIGLNTASLVAFVVGLGCVLAAVFLGFFYTAATVLDWQALQVWRLEWLLGGAVAFIAGVLLKNTQRA